MRTVKINRKYWLNGNTTDASTMCNELNQRCCLGFAANQIHRIPLQDMYESCGATPASVMEECNITPKLNLLAYRQREENFNMYRESAFSDKAMEINDDTNLTNRERERKLTKLFRENGINLEFYGEYPTREQLKEMNEWEDDEPRLKRFAK